MQTLNVLYACNENYAPFAGISMYSLFQNNKDLDRIRVYLVEDEVTDQSLDRLKNQAESFERELIIVDAAEIIEKIKALNIPSYRGSYTTNFRLFFDTFLAEDAENLLYIDCDTLVTDSLFPLLSRDMQGKAVGVVQDSLTARYKALVGFSPEDRYFNAGVTWINVTEWKRQEISKKLMDYIQNVRSRYCNPDQDLLNVVLRGNTFFLPPEYNFQPVHRAYSDKAYFAAYPNPVYYTSEELEHARQNPKILHVYRFLGDFPWHAGNLHPDNALFDRYKDASLWSDYQKKPAGRGLIFAVEKLLYRLLPKAWFLKLFEAITLYSFKKQDKQLKKEQ